jgi:uncharacterized protein
MAQYHKIINDPVYGFITIDHPLLFKVIEHPAYQRLRRIHQMALAYLVYPGATHSRLHHSLGAYHLMCSALQELRLKGVVITEQEALSAKIAILLHDIGHGPFSHALESSIVENMHHETLSLAIMKHINTNLDGALDMAIDIFTNTYPKKFLYQLISGQLDVDRMDYLTRDSFYTGVSEGVIGYDRILKMLNVVNDKLVVEEKGVFSVEKFLIARRLMYEQVYLHKTVLAAEKILVQIIKRVVYLVQNNQIAVSGLLGDFLHKKDYVYASEATLLNAYIQLDDIDVLMQIKQWVSANDKVLSILCTAIINRNLLKCNFIDKPLSDMRKKEIINDICKKYDLSNKDATWLLIEGNLNVSTYNIDEDSIMILKKDGTLVKINDIHNSLVNMETVKVIDKKFICYLI